MHGYNNNEKKPITTCMGRTMRRRNQYQHAWIEQQLEETNNNIHG